jgi:ATP-dependent helicase HrpA
VPGEWILTPALLLEAMVADRRRLASRWGQLQKHWQSGRAPDPRAIDQVRDEWERSAAAARLREQNRPKPDFSTRRLPILDHRDTIAKAIRENQVCVVCGETGSGKTTQLPQICLELGLGTRGIIGHTQPRRIAARTLAARIAEELDVPRDSRAVGYKVRFGDQTDRSTYLKVMTDGILLAETQGDRLLEQYDTIIIDEAHERSLNIDFMLGYLRQLLPKRPDLKVIITSATIDPERFSRHFGGAPIISVSGRTYPVEIVYHPLDETAEGEVADARDQERGIVDAIDELTLGDGGRGDVLVFLSGEREIREAAEALRKHHPPGTEILPLYARLSPAEQQRIFQAHATRRIVLATNVAETSLTVPGIRYVVDTGYARLSRYSPRQKIQRLPIEAISQASANQRAGRCGRVEAGVCVRLYAEQDYKNRATFTEPEILRTNLASVILQMKALRLGAVEEFPFVESPDSRLIKDGYETLHELGAIDERGELTPTGHSLARLPVDPRIGRMLLASDAEGCLTEMLILAAALSVQDPRDRPSEKQDQADLTHKRFADERSDFLAYLNLWRYIREQERHLSGSKMRQFCRDNFLSFMRVREWEEVHSQLRELSGEIGLRAQAKPASYEQIHRALLTGLLSNVGSKTDTNEYQGARNSKFLVWPGSTLFKKSPKWIAAAEIVQTSKLYARCCCRISPEWIEELGGHVLRRSHSDVHWLREEGQVCAFERVTLYGLVLVPRRRVQYGPIDPADARDVFIQHAMVQDEWDCEAPFAQHNRALVAQVREMEAKIRVRDILAEQKAIYEFYDKRLPAGVYSVPTFERWRRDAERTNPRSLYMTAGDVMRRDPYEITPERFPDRVHAAGTSLNISYKLEPGAEDDGLSMDVPIENLPQLSAERCEWLVPGMLREKIAALIKSLPKPLRVQIEAAPVAESLAAALKFGEGPLADALSRELSKQRGIDIPASAWQFKGIPDHLRMLIRVIDDRGQIAAAGRDIAELQARFAQRAKRQLETLARRSFGREGLTAWEFDALPDTFQTTRNGVTIVGCPALVDRTDSIALTLVDTPAHARFATYRGLRRLFALQAANEIEAHLYAQKNRDRLAILYGPLGTPSQLQSDLACLIAERAFLSGPGGHDAIVQQVRTRDAFEERLADRWGKVGLVTRETCEFVHTLLSLRQAVALRLERQIPDTWGENAKDIKDQLARLAFPGFLGRVTDDRLREMPRYFDAMALRLRKLENGNAGRDLRELNALRPLWNRYFNALASIEAGTSGGAGAAGHASTFWPDPRIDPAEVEQHRWLLEELRVSMFAERLGTREPVSAKRINEHWESIKPAPGAEQGAHASKHSKHDKGKPDAVHHSRPDSNKHDAKSSDPTNAGKPASDAVPPRSTPIDPKSIKSALTLGQSSIQVPGKPKTSK